MRNDLALLGLRLSGLLLAFGHGWAKVAALSSGRTGFVDGVAEMGFPLPLLFAWGAAIGEFGGGLCVALGLLTRYAAALAGCTMFVAAFLRHKAHLQLMAALGWAQIEPETLRGWGDPERALLFLLIMIGVGVTGPGRLALDRFVRIGR